MYVNITIMSEHSVNLIIKYKFALKRMIYMFTCTILTQDVASFA